MLDAGLKNAADQLGRRLNLKSTPVALGMLVDAWAKGDITDIDPDAPEFVKMFEELAEQATTQAA